MPGSASNARPRKRSRKLAVGKFKALVWPAIIITAVVVLDQLTKVWAVTALTDQPSKRVLGDFLMFTLVYNEGGAMGTNFGSSGFYLIIAFIVIPILLFFIWKERRRTPLTLALAFIVAGALGNLIDRVRIGRVIDFVDVDFFHINVGNFHLERWWTFNVADASISCALVFLVLYQLFFHRHSRPTSMQPSSLSSTSAPSSDSTLP